MLGGCFITELYPRPLFTFYFETGSHLVTQADLDLIILLWQLLVANITGHTARTGYFCTFEAQLSQEVKLEVLSLDFSRGDLGMQIPFVSLLRPREGASLYFIISQGSNLLFPFSLCW